MYRCEICGAEFDEPRVKSWSEPMPDGFWEPCRQVLCPVCGQAHFEKAYDEETEEEA